MIFCLAASSAAALRGAIETMLAAQGGAARSIRNQSQKVLTLVEQVQAGGGGGGAGGGGKKKPRVG